MKIILHSNYDSNIPLEVDGVRPDVIDGLGSSTHLLENVKGLQVWRGRRRHRLDDFFQVDIDEAFSETIGVVESLNVAIHWQGNLSRVCRIGESMVSGAMTVSGDCGRHIGEQMSGGTLTIDGSVGDYLGASMTGGRIVVSGNAENHVGSVLPGAKRGMNRGEIFVQGNAGRGLGQAMRRGTIVVGGSTDDLAGWNMIAGTIVVLGSLGANIGAGMKRGTIVEVRCSNVSQQRSDRQKLLPSFAEGKPGGVPILKMIGNWLAMQRSSDGQGIYSHKQLERLHQPFQMFHGDLLHGGNGEVFIAI